jgi:hypothetical protein
MGYNLIVNKYKKIRLSENRKPNLIEGYWNLILMLPLLLASIRK